MPSLQITEKFCNGCKQTLSIELFSKSKRDGYASRCKPCLNKESRDRKRVQAQDPEYRKKMALKAREYRKIKPRSYLTRKKEWLKSLYGMTLEEYDNMFNKQNGVCAICFQPCKSKKGLAVDHNHKTGKVRGLLCANCNGAIGMLQEDPAIIDRAKEYILRGIDA